MPWTTLLIIGGSALMCYLFFVGHTVVLHNCAHYSMFRSRRLNVLVGNIICSTQWMHFEGWRIAHMLHHRYANTPHDPHCVDRPMIPYLLTHYLRIAVLLGSPLRLAKSVVPTLLVVAAVVAWQGYTGHWMRGLAWVAAFWAVPVVFSQIMVAHFNYITHVGLSPGRGKDTRNLTRGGWPLINWLTFNLYLHREHHLHPRQAIPRLPEPQEATKNVPATGQADIAQPEDAPPASVQMPRREAPTDQRFLRGKAA